MTMKKLILMLIALLFLFITGQAKADSDINNDKGEVKRILKKVSPSIVKVIAENHKRYYATGIAIDKDHIISNRKVLPRNYHHLYIQTIDGYRYAAKIVAKDKASSIIVLKIDKKILTPIKRAKGGEAGDWVALVGAFYRKFPAIYHGFISSASDQELLLNAPVAPGASGGAVVNRKGQLVGVVRGRFAFVERPDYTYVSPEAEVVIRSSRSRHRELCYALPVKKVLDISNDLKKYGKVRRGWLGIRLVLTPNGVSISDVTRNSPAEKAGIRAGDVLIKIDGKKIHSSRDVQQTIGSLKPEEKTKIVVLRNNLNKSLLAVIGEQRSGNLRYNYKFPKRLTAPNVVSEVPERLPQLENYVFTIVGSRTLGVDTMTLSSELAKEFKIKEGTGLLVSKVHRNSAANKSSFMVADVIVKIGDRNITKTSDLRIALNELEEKESVPVMVYRKGKLRKINVIPEKNEEFGSIFKQFNNKLKDIHNRMENDKEFQINDPERIRKESALINRIQEQYIQKEQKKKNSIQNKKMEMYKKQLEIMKKEQERMRKEMKRMMELLEKQEKDKKNKQAA
jgi:serine protease Do